MRQIDGSRAPANPDSPSGAVLTMQRELWEGYYSVTLGFNKGYPAYSPKAFGFDTLGTVEYESDEEMEEEQRLEIGPALDMLEAEAVPDGKVAAGSFAAALDLLAQRSHLRIFAEVFLKDKRPLRFTRGKPEFLLSHICRDYGCDWRKVGDDYIVWSKSWAQDRAADVPAEILNHWRQAREKQGRFELDDLVEMTELSDAKLVTLGRVLGINGPFAYFNRDALRILSTIPRQARMAAFGPNGSELPANNPQIVSLLAYYFKREQIAPPLRVRLERREQGTGEGIVVSFADRLGEAPRTGWIMLGPKPNDPPPKGP